MNNSCVCLITLKPEETWLDFLSKFTSYPIYIIVDDNSVNYKELYARYSNIHIIQIENQACKDAGYNNVNFLVKKEISGWAKAIYYFSVVNTSYNNVWFFEDDIFFQNEKTLIDIDSKYSDSDLLSNNYGENTTGEKGTWLWRNITIQFPPPYYCAMVCSVRMSKAMLSAIKDYATEHKTLFFIEALFSSLCKKNGLKYDTPSELTTIVWQKNFINSDINSTNLFHPVKDLAKHVYFRSLV